MSVYLPKTKFNLYSDVKKTEEDVLKFWQEINLEQQRKAKNKGNEKFVLHDGPPYANGPLHIGHAENKFWKDCLNKIFWQNGYDLNFKLGWDGHGLPIENAVEKQLKKDGIDKKTLTRSEFWDKCYDFAKHWMSVQKDQFEKMAIFADYEDVYVTFYEKESLGIIECIHQFLAQDLIEHRFRPTLWSYAEKTALAYAEVEYKDKVSDSIYILFPVIKTDIENLKNANLIVWTTTPWTLPANETVAFNKDFEYLIVEASGKKYCILEKLINAVAINVVELKDYKIIEKIKGSKLENTYVEHSLKEFNQTGKLRKLIHSNHVEDEKGTGLVHIAPAHGEEDFALGRENNLDIIDLLDADGCFKKDVPLVAEKSVKEAQTIVLNALKEQEKCLKHEEFTHSYPHSWRSKAPLIYRLTKQWFLKMKPIKEKALKALEDDLKWVPNEGKNRFVSMLSVREDWCISRQRIWGVPIAIFYNKETGQLLNEKAFLEKTLKFLEESGVKEWWNVKISEIDSNYKDDEWVKVQDIVDIWFESGATQFFILQKENLFPATVYLEGSDQHRGWFQSSLLISAFQTGKAPWQNLVTHGFCLDGSKQKMSKSLGNVVDPATWGVDELRLFFSAQNLCSDVSLNESSVKHAKEMLFRFKNTMKFILGMVAVEEDKNHLSEELNYDDLGLIEKWLLNKLSKLEFEYEKILKTFQVNSFVNLLYEFCAQDLSAFYFDIKKDALYCNLQSDIERKKIMKCLQIVLNKLFLWLSNITPFFAQEAWMCYLEESNIDNLPTSVHLLQQTKLPELYKNEEANLVLEKLREVRRKIYQKIEELREGKILATSQESEVVLTSDMNLTNLSDKEFLTLIKEICLISKVSFEKQFQVFKFDGKKCVRCRFFYKEIDDNSHCKRCASVIDCI